MTSFGTHLDPIPPQQKQWSKNGPKMVWDVMFGRSAKKNNYFGIISVPGAKFAYHAGFSIKKRFSFAKCRPGQ